MCPGTICLGPNIPSLCGALGKYFLSLEMGLRFQRCSEGPSRAQVVSASCPIVIMLALKPPSMEP